MKNKGKVWVDIDKVAKASSVPRANKKWYKIMKEVPKGEKSSN